MAFVGIYRQPVLCNLRPREAEWLGQELHNSEHPILFDADGFEHRVSSRGEMIKGYGECTFFPSREQRDWSKFTAPWYKKEKFDPTTLNPFDKVLVRDLSARRWRCAIFSHVRKEDENYTFKYITTACTYEFCIPYNEDTRHLVGTTDEAPEYYRYWE